MVRNIQNNNLEDPAKQELFFIRNADRFYQKRTRTVNYYINYIKTRGEMECNEIPQEKL